ncbi:hypothetical protein HK097_007229 [Rhizophlyctis rosea]|uniref:Barwin domain-containing protein n=1 Tax=Rhizophlyctis rosea TaxID=64517 RepID=A0AAD5SEW6_9FUNG|nr:hypothetical protein HK097_007229 [Rhizophlyctis rosea]
MQFLNSALTAITLALCVVDSLAAPSKIPTTHSGSMTLRRDLGLQKRGGSGRMTYYGTSNDGPDKYYGACGYEPHTVSANYVALNPTDFRGKSTCGQCIRLRSGNHCTVARVVDLCPSCAPGAVDVGMDIFKNLCDGGEGEAVQVGVKNVDWDGPFPCNSPEVQCGSGQSYQTTNPGSTVAAASAPADSSSSAQSTEEKCDDYYPYTDGYTCQEQASWGKCTMYWLNGYCNRSCGRCGTGSRLPAA